MTCSSWVHGRIFESLKIDPHQFFIGTSKNFTLRVLDSNYSDLFASELLGIRVWTRGKLTSSSDLSQCVSLDTSWIMSVAWKWSVYIIFSSPLFLGHTFLGLFLSIAISRFCMPMPSLMNFFKYFQDLKISSWVEIILLVDGCLCIASVQASI